MVDKNELKSLADLLEETWDSMDGVINPFLVLAHTAICWHSRERPAPSRPAALTEPLFLLHTGTVYGNERGDWEIEASSGKAVDAYCDANPGKTVGLYLAQPAAAVPEGYSEDEIADAFITVGVWDNKFEALMDCLRASRSRAMLAAAERKGGE